MIVVRNTLVAKPGQASALAAQIKTAAAVAGFPNARVLTDITGEFNRVMLEYEVDSIGGFEKTLHTYATDQKLREAMKGYTELWTTGTRELLRIV